MSLWHSMLTLTRQGLHRVHNAITCHTLRRSGAVPCSCTRSSKATGQHGTGPTHGCRSMVVIEPSGTALLAWKDSRKWQRRTWERERGRVVHKFDIYTDTNDTPIMFCKRCGVSYVMYRDKRILAMGFSWRSMPFQDAQGLDIDQPTKPCDKRWWQRR